MSLLDDACRIGSFAVLDARYGHYRDRYYRAVALEGSDAGSLSWCVFNLATSFASYAPSLAGVPPVLAALAVSGTARRENEDAIILASPWFVPLKDVLLESAMQGVSLDDDVAAFIFASVLRAIAIDDPPRLPFVDEASVGIAADGSVLFFGWRSFGGGQAWDAASPARVWRELGDLSRRLFREPAAHGQAPFPVARAGHTVAQLLSTASLALDVQTAHIARAFAKLADDVGGASDGEAQRTRLAGIVAGVFGQRLRDRAEIDEELAMVPLDELRALPPPK